MLNQWQQDIFDKISHGAKNGKIMTITSGRQVGKSDWNRVVEEWNDMLEQRRLSYKMLDKSTVDGAMWYTIRCNSQVAKWIRSQPQTLGWYEHSIATGAWCGVDNVFDVHEALYLQIGLKFETVESY
jgi:hypothetical protein